MRTILTIIADVVMVLFIGVAVSTLALMILWFFLTANGANPFR